MPPNSNYYFNQSRKLHSAERGKFRSPSDFPMRKNQQLSVENRLVGGQRGVEAPPVELVRVARDR
jgi:hypothetical protein